MSPGTRIRRTGKALSGITRKHYVEQAPSREGTTAGGNYANSGSGLFLNQGRRRAAPFRDLEISPRTEAAEAIVLFHEPG